MCYWHVLRFILSAARKTDCHGVLEISTRLVYMEIMKILILGAAVLFSSENVLIRA